MTDRPARRTPNRSPERRPRLPATPDASSDSGGSSPVDVRLIGDEAAVRALVAALQKAASCGPASYRPSRYGDGTRAYLSVVVPAEPTPPTIEG
ncbi:hypothetical protein [Streptomyces umbrinus]|uniref:hypothetical protein n=1 Tax=Streptomyces umbrinus TaxID=67370 RepID=UPI003418CE1B